MGGGDFEIEFLMPLIIISAEALPGSGEGKGLRKCYQCRTFIVNRFKNPAFNPTQLLSSSIHWTWIDLYFTSISSLGPQGDTPQDQQDEGFMSEDTFVPRKQSTRDELKSVAYRLIQEMDEARNDGVWTWTLIYQIIFGTLYNFIASKKIRLIKQIPCHFISFSSNFSPFPIKN